MALPPVGNRNSNAGEAWQLAKRRAVLANRIVQRPKQRSTHFRSRQRTRRDILKQLDMQQGDSFEYHCTYWRNPYQLPRIAWEMLMLVVVLWELIITPYYMAFVPSAFDTLTVAAWTTEPWAACALLLPSCFAAVDIAYSFVAGWDTNEKLELRLSQIMKLYVLSFPFHFFWDTLSVIPFWSLPGAPSWLHGCRMLRCTRLSRTLHHLSPDVVRRASVRFELTRNIVTFLTITHVSCCALRSTVERSFCCPAFWSYSAAVQYNAGRRT